MEALFDQAALTEHDVDLATSGLCGTFALALYREVIRRGVPALLVFACLGKPDGTPEFVPGHEGDIRQIRWRHALVKVGNDFYDVEGRVEVAHVYENYCWNQVVAGGVSIPVTLRQFIDILRQTRSSYDGRNYVRWKRALSR